MSVEASLYFVKGEIFIRDVCPNPVSHHTRASTFWVLTFFFAGSNVNWSQKYLQYAACAPLCPVRWFSQKTFIRNSDAFFVLSYYEVYYHSSEHYPGNRAVLAPIARNISTTKPNQMKQQTLRTLQTEHIIEGVPWLKKNTTWKRMGWPAAKHEYYNKPHSSMSPLSFWQAYKVNTRGRTIKRSKERDVMKREIIKLNRSGNWRKTQGDYKFEDEDEQ